MIQRSHFFVTIAALIAFVSYADDPTATQAPSMENPKPETQNLSLTQAKEKLAILLAGDQVQRLDFQGTSREAAMATIHQTVDAYFATAAELFGELGYTAQADIAVQVILGLEAHKIRQTVKTLPKTDSFVVKSEETAQNIGALIGQVAAIIVRVTLGHDAPAGHRVGTRIFNEVVVDTENGVPLLNQYLSAVQELAKQPDERLKHLLIIGD